MLSIFILNSPLGPLVRLPLSLSLIHYFLLSSVLSSFLYLSRSFSLQSFLPLTLTLSFSFNCAYSRLALYRILFLSIPSLSCSLFSPSKSLSSSLFHTPSVSCSASTARSFSFLLFSSYFSFNASYLSLSPSLSIPPTSTPLFLRFFLSPSLSNFLPLPLLALFIISFSHILLPQFFF